MVIFAVAELSFFPAAAVLLLGYVTVVYWHSIDVTTGLYGSLF